MRIRVSHRHAIRTESRAKTSGFASVRGTAGAPRRRIGGFWTGGGADSTVGTHRGYRGGSGGRGEYGSETRLHR